MIKTAYLSNSVADPDPNLGPDPDPDPSIIMQI
jgi:hypothetical protein